MAKNERKQETIFTDLIFEVNKLNTAQFSHGKESNEYKAIHAASLKIIKELNGLYGKGYASLSQARQLIQQEYARNKGSKAGTK